MIVHDDEYMIYYGGADNCIALATVPVNEVEKEF
jgi:predicted GH43/DUF377 family glycosyl hydrolase